MKLRRAVPEDLPYILRVEKQYSELGFVGPDDFETHQRRLCDPDCLYWLVESEGRPAGYVILRGLASPNRSIELKRIIIAEPGRGLGKQVMGAILAEVFDTVSAHRLWLDVFEDNLRAQHVYRSVGFVQEGMLRECVRYRDRYRSLILMSMLESEYRAKR
jgi:RimJ/RimL family protein N-acetyltransferase